MASSDAVVTRRRDGDAGLRVVGCAGALRADAGPPLPPPLCRATVRPAEAAAAPSDPVCSLGGSASSIASSARLRDDVMASRSDALSDEPFLTPPDPGGVSATTSRCLTSPQWPQYRDDTTRPVLHDAPGLVPGPAPGTASGGEEACAETSPQLSQPRPSIPAERATSDAQSASSDFASLVLTDLPIGDSETQSLLPMWAMRPVPASLTREMPQRAASDDAFKDLKSLNGRSTSPPGGADIAEAAFSAVGTNEPSVSPVAAATDSTACGAADGAAMGPSAVSSMSKSPDEPEMSSETSESNREAVNRARNVSPPTSYSTSTL